MEANTYHNFLETELTEKLKDKVVNHRNRFFKFLSNRYLEFLPLTISYEGLEKTNIDYIQLEIMLRHGYNVCIGEYGFGDKTKIGIIGFTNSNLYTNENFFTRKPLVKNDITFTIPEKLIKQTYKEILKIDGSGNFVVVSNKAININSDFTIIEHYVSEMSEIVASRYSLIIQSKVNTVLRDENNSEDMNEIVSDLYNGSPFFKTTLQFDVDDHIIKIGNTETLQFLPELKREYQNKIAELNSILGLNSLGVEKESGVSEIEANSNKSFKKANENMYLFSRQKAFDLLNKKYKLNIQAEYSDSMVKNLSSLEKLEVLT